MKTVATALRVAIESIGIMREKVAVMIEEAEKIAEQANAMQDWIVLITEEAYARALDVYQTERAAQKVEEVLDKLRSSEDDPLAGPLEF